MTEVYTDPVIFRWMVEDSLLYKGDNETLEMFRDMDKHVPSEYLQGLFGEHAAPEELMSVCIDRLHKLLDAADEETEPGFIKKLSRKPAVTLLENLMKEDTSIHMRFYGGTFLKNVSDMKSSAGFPYFLRKFTAIMYPASETLTNHPYMKKARGGKADAVEAHRVNFNGLLINMTSSLFYAYMLPEPVQTRTGVQEGNMDWLAKWELYSQLIRWAKEN